MAEKMKRKAGHEKTSKEMVVVAVVVYVDAPASVQYQPRAAGDDVQSSHVTPTHRRCSCVIVRVARI